MPFDYMGPPERKPVLLRYDIFEDLGSAEELRSDSGGFGATLDESLKIVPYSWLQMNDNAMDRFHVHVLHSTFSIVQFVPEFAVMPKVDFFTTANGVCYSAKRRLEDGREYERLSSWFVPNVTASRISLISQRAEPSGSGGYCLLMIHTSRWSRFTAWRSLHLRL